MTLQKIMLRASGIILLVGFFFFLLWVNKQVDWLLWISGLAVTIFLLMPAVFLMVWPDTAIVYLNGIVTMFFRPHINRLGYPVNMGPPPRVIEKHRWNHLSGGEQIWVILAVCLITALGLVIARYTFWPGLLEWTTGLF